MKATKQQLIEAKALIQDKKNWTKGALSRNIDGQAVWVNDPEATCYCALGALAKASGMDKIDGRSKTAEGLLSAALDMGWLTVENLNDRAGHEKVMLMFKKAIEEAPE